MMLSLILLAPEVSLERILALSERPGWELAHDVMPGAYNHRALVWLVEGDQGRVTYLEDARFYTRTLMVEGPASDLLETQLRATFAQLDPEELFAQIQHEDPVEAASALFATTPLVAPDEHDPAYEALLAELLAGDEPAPEPLARAAVMVAEWLAWPQLCEPLEAAARRPERHSAQMAQRALGALG